MTVNQRIIEGSSCPASDTHPSPEAAAVSLLIVDEGGLVEYVTSNFLALIAAPDPEPATWIGRGFGECFPGNDLPVVPSDTCHAAGSFRGFDGLSWPMAWTHLPGGNWIGVHSAATRPERGPGQTDDLTGLGNRSHLKAAFTCLLGRQTGADTALTAIYLDLDHFKRVNDCLSHAVGDGLLRKVAERLRKILRSEDIPVRLGGDEFAILIPNLDVSAAEEIAQRIIKMLSRPFLVDGHQITIGASLGLARYDAHDEGLEPLLQRADIALYESKRKGRGRFHWYRREMSRALKERREIENDLRKALDLDQFQLVFQPQYSFEKGRVSGFEALIRWQHPDRGLVSPVQFIAIAEEIGLIVPIGSWVLETACLAACEWPAEISVAVNVSPLQFESDGFVDTVAEALSASGLAAERLELEITETTLLRNEASVIDVMRELRALGVRISLDDFGIGYSSLNYLRKFPFDKIKIDQSFVREPFADASAHQIVRAVAELGSAFGMSVLAEGVETVDQLSRIRAQGCSAAQGYLLAAPMPPAEIDAYLRARRPGTRDRDLPNDKEMINDPDRP
ncbi:EAL domain-containing protein [Roseovarius sp. SCSIO 43702]|uniref:putative bifunctional diguanylate cyclase/phosphodiesterase n=1 Tax=Roseovarius sp. SCSIO 43702 TaxID=2823043 RepID=UPI001C731A2E|nr:EAL domain-containing protein [Roseovarius sp. SCSIO 43702]QYX56172.1 EAL domain-containing protein [Roseovarius sp. SCSIO 43702]